MDKDNSLLYLLFSLHLACSNNVDRSALSNSSQNLYDYINAISDDEIREDLLEKFDKYEDGFSSYSGDLSHYFYKTGFRDAICLLFESIGEKKSIKEVLDNL